MSRNSFYFFIFSFIPVVLFFYRPIGTGDLSIWIALGNDAIESLKIITKDTYTVAETLTMVYPVLITLIYGVVFKLGGIELAAILHAFVPTAWVYIWYRYLKMHTVSYSESSDYWDIKTFSVLIISYLGLALVYVARPALVATIPLLVGYYFISVWKDKLYSTKNILLLFITEVLWVNIHGSFLLLPLMLIWQIPFYLTVGNLKLALNRSLTVILLLLATLLNPFTYEVIPYTWLTASISKARGLDEWFPPHYFDYPFASWYFYFVSIILFAVFLAKFRKHCSFLKILSDPFFMFWLSGFFAIRNTFFIFLILPIFVFKSLVLKKAVIHYVKSKYSPVFNTAIVVMIIAAAILVNPYFKNYIAEYLPAGYRPIYNKNYRVEKINAYLSSHSGAIFNSWEFGSDLALAQKNKYFIDTRNIIFTDAVNAEYDAFNRNPQLNTDFLIKYDFRFFLIHERRSGLIEWLKRRPDIRLVLVEGPALLFEKIGK